MPEDFDMFSDTNSNQPQLQQQNKALKIAQPVKQQNASNNTVQQSTVQTVNLYDTKSDYTDQEWELRQDTYVIESKKILTGNEMYQLTPSDISIAASKLEALLAPLRIDNIYCSQEVYHWEAIQKEQKEELFNDVKQSAQANGQKLTVDETKSAIAKVMNSKPLKDGLNIFQLVIKYNKRKIFTDGMIKVLQDKKDLLITHSGILKIENSINAFTQSVPTNNQINAMRN